jgi:Bacterial SCP ortholog
MPCHGSFARPRAARECRRRKSYRPVVSPAHNKSESVKDALDALDDGAEPDRPVLRDAVRALLAELARVAPGRSVEVRIPPFGAIQCVAGPRHTRGTPPNVVETDPMTWLLVCTGRLTWADATAQGRLRASGIRTDLTEFMPVWGRD